MEILGSVNGPRNGGLNFGDFLDSGGNLKAVWPRVIIKQPTTSCNRVLLLSPPTYVHTLYYSALSAFLFIIVDVFTFLIQRDTLYNVLLSLISLFLTYVHN